MRVIKVRAGDGECDEVREIADLWWKCASQRESIEVQSYELRALSNGRRDGASNAAEGEVETREGNELLDVVADRSSDGSLLEVDGGEIR